MVLVVAGWGLCWDWLLELLMEPLQCRCCPCWVRWLGRTAASMLELLMEPLHSLALHLLHQLQSLLEPLPGADCWG